MANLNGLVTQCTEAKNAAEAALTACDSLQNTPEQIAAHGRATAAAEAALVSYNSAIQRRDEANTLN